MSGWPPQLSNYRLAIDKVIDAQQKYYQLRYNQKKPMTDPLMMQAHQHLQSCHDELNVEKEKLGMVIKPLVIND